MNLEDCITPDFTCFYGGVDLNTIPYFFAVERFPNVSPDINLQTAPLIRQHGQVLINRLFTKKTIPVNGVIIAPNRQAYEQCFDLLKQTVLSQMQQPLVLLQSGVSRQYTATVAELDETFVEAGKSIITINFECEDPFGYDAVAITESHSGVTTSPYAFSTVFDSSIQVEPVFEVVINSLTDGTNKLITVGNSLSTKLIGVRRTWVANDQLVVDCQNKNVTVNGLAIDYTGWFAEFDPETANAVYSDTFTTRNVTLILSYMKKYL
jgi:predicted phage tail component-like protein